MEATTTTTTSPPSATGGLLVIFGSIIFIIFIVVLAIVFSYLSYKIKVGYIKGIIKDANKEIEEEKIKQT